MYTLQRIERLNSRLNDAKALRQQIIHSPHLTDGHRRDYLTRNSHVLVRLRRLLTEAQFDHAERRRQNATETIPPELELVVGREKATDKSCQIRGIAAENVVRIPTALNNRASRAGGAQS